MFCKIIKVVTPIKLDANLIGVFYIISLNSEFNQLFIIIQKFRYFYWDIMLKLYCQIHL